ACQQRTRSAAAGQPRESGVRSAAAALLAQKMDTRSRHEAPGKTPAVAAGTRPAGRLVAAEADVVQRVVEDTPPAPASVQTDAAGKRSEGARLWRRRFHSAHEFVTGFRWWIHKETWLLLALILRSEA